MMGVETFILLKGAVLELKTPKQAEISMTLLPTILWV
jgi:hypothetical protein